MHILVIGAGAIGFQLSKQLSQDGHDITQIDTDPSRVKRVSEQLDIIVAEGNGTSLQDLRGLGIEQVDLVAAMTTNDEVNLLACRMAKKLGVQSAIARIRNPEFTAPDFIFSPVNSASISSSTPRRKPPTPSSASSASPVPPI